MQARILRKETRTPYVTGALKLRRILDDDTFIVSYPRSGNTWIRFLIAHILHPEKTIHFGTIDRFCPDLYRSHRIANGMAPPRFLKSHHPFYGRYPKSIYIYRDGRDVFVSYYFYLKQRGVSDKSFSQFLRGKLPRHPRYILPWHEHVSQALDFAQEYPERMLLLRYEGIETAGYEYARDIARFCRLHVSDRALRTAAEKSTFEHLKRIERYYGPEIERFPEVEFFRSGKSGQWKAHFSKDDLDFFETIAGSTLERLGYR
jgi:estrone sulfotransferase